MHGETMKITGLVFVGHINESRIEGCWSIGCLNLFSISFHLPSVSKHKRPV